MTSASDTERAPTRDVIKYAEKIGVISGKARSEKKRALGLSGLIASIVAFPFWYIGFRILLESEQVALVVVCLAIAFGIANEIYRKVGAEIDGRWLMSVLDLRIHTAKETVINAIGAHNNRMLELDEMYVRYIRGMKKPS